MGYETLTFFALAFALSFVFTFILMPILCKGLGKYLKDTPTALKNHEGIVPLVGGISIMFGTLEIIFQNY